MDMTWKQFKEIVDRKIAEAGKDDNVHIEYIDVSATTLSYAKNPEEALDVDVGRFGLSVS